MGRFNEHNRRGSFDASRSRREGGFSGRRNGGFGGNRFGGRGFGGNSERPQMHNATCSKCGNERQVPFRPTGDKPVFCSDCFRKEGGADRGFGGDRREQSMHSSSGISQAQFKQLNDKLDKIISFMQELEIEVVEDDEEGDEDDEDEDEE